MEWWYGLAAPVEPENATSRDRERVRMGRLSSIILLIIFCFGLSQVPTALNSTNHLFLFIVLVALVINVGALIFNRQGKVMAVGITMVTVVELAFILIVLMTFRPLTARNLVFLIYWWSPN
jgi:hypothetical protein